MDIATWLGQQLDEDEQGAHDARHDLDGVWTCVERSDRSLKVVDSLGYSIAENEEADSAPWWTLPHIARHDPASVLRKVAVMRRIVELHTTGAYRDYQCGNADHIQEWQCERAGEPYVEHRYCEVCGHDCVELPLLAELYDDRAGHDPAWAVADSA